MKVTRRTFELLSISGWHPGRKVDCTGSIEYLKNKGFVINPLIISFLEEFGQLEFDLLSPYEDSSIDKHHTFPKKAIGSLGANDFAYFEALFGERLVPVGELYNRHLYIFISESGKMYTDLGLVGRNYMTSFDNIFSRVIELPIQNFNNSDAYNSHTITIFTDKTMPDILYAEEDQHDEEDGKKLKYFACSGIYGLNPSFLPEKKLQTPIEYRDYYKLGLTDAGIDRIMMENSDLLRGKDIQKIRGELFKMRRAIFKLKEMARNKKAFSFDGTESFEMWPVEHCSEIWAARTAILNGVRFENIAFSVIRRADNGILNMCNNCKRIFENNYRVNSLL
jgi:hypothetical protein